MDWPYKYFTKEEMACKCGCGALPQPEFMLKLDQLRKEYGSPIVVTSGARCPTHNAAVSRTGLTGEHTLGLCADIGCSNPEALHIVARAIALGFTRIGVSQSSDRPRFVHLGIATPDNGFPIAIWSY